LRKFAVIAALVALMAMPATAFAHAELETAEPEVDSTVDQAPTEIRMTMSEEVAAGSRVTVTDGCKDEVGGRVARSGNEMTIPVTGGRPGRWNVEFSAVSADDGHAESGSYSFVVSGKKDCSDESTETPDEPEPSIGDGGTPIENDDEGSSFPVVPLLIGTVVLVGGAFLLRRGTSGP
jgi:methionine-rich copper-binding protein CopC